MDNTQSRKELEALMKKCVMCAGCHAGCPTYRLTRYEHDAARGKVVLAKALFDGEIEPDAKLAETFEHCLNCMNCVEVCPAGANLVKVINAARNEIFNRNGNNYTAKFIYRTFLPNRGWLTLLAMKLAGLTKIFRSLPALSFLPFVREGKKKSFPDFKFTRLKDSLPETLSPKNPPIMKVGYFTGCMADSVYHETGRAVAEILQAAGVETTLLKDEVCCGAPAYFAGDHDAARMAARKNIALFLDKGFDFIVTSCATCGSVLKEIYPELSDHPRAAEFAGKVVDYQKLIADRLLDRLEFKEPAEGEKPLKVTYHDPCHLRRAMKVVAEPRKILKNLPGIEYVELPDAGSCCGGAGSFALAFYGDSLEIGALKGESVRKSGAEMVLSACPSCRMQLTEITERFAPGVKTADTAQIVRKLLKE